MKTNYCRLKGGAQLYEFKHTAEVYGGGVISRERVCSLRSPFPLHFGQETQLRGKSGASGFCNITLFFFLLPSSLGLF